MGRTLRSTIPMTIGLVIAIVVLLVPFSVSCSKPPAPTAAFTASYVSGDLLTEGADLQVRHHSLSSSTTSPAGRLIRGDGISGMGLSLKGAMKSRETLSTHTRQRIPASLSSLQSGDLGAKTRRWSRAL